MNRAVVITVSDSAAEGSREDKSGPAVVEKLRHAGFEVTLRDAIPDERDQIAAVLRAEADAGGPLAVFTTGGTGIAPRDITPEATRDVIEREVPGFGELMRARGRESTPFAVLSRAIAGTRGGVLIINLPWVAARSGGIAGCYFGVGPARAGPDQRTYSAFRVLQGVPEKVENWNR